VAYTAYQGMIMVVGGESRATGTFKENEAFDPKSGRWVTLAPMPEGRHGFGAAVLGRNVFFAGGSLQPGADAVTDQLIVFNLP
jgi:Kelch motif